MPYTFTVEDDQFKKYVEWKREHDKICPQTKVGAIGGKETYLFTQTSLGLITVIKCACEEELDLTNYDEW